jgi:hypothetical protein
MDDDWLNNDWAWRMAIAPAWYNILMHHSYGVNIPYHLPPLPNYCQLPLLLGLIPPIYIKTPLPICLNPLFPVYGLPVPSLWYCYGCG